MLKKLTLKNFQSHKDSVLEFNPGVNVIRGVSDHGKSVIYRAIELLATNKPSMDKGGFMRHGCKDLLIEGEYDDHTVSRFKAPGKNGYMLDGKPLNAIGQSVPEEVSKAINMAEVNFQDQDAGIFMLNATGGEISRDLNAAAGIDDMDDALTNIGSVLRAASEKVKLSETACIQAAQDKIKYAALPDLVERAAKLEKLQIKLEGDRERRRAILKLLAVKERVEEALLKAALPTNMTERLVKVHKLHTECVMLGVKSSQIHTAIQTLKDVQKAKSREDAIAGLDVDTLRDLWNRRRDLRVKSKAIQEILSSLVVTRQRCNELNLKINAAEGKLKAIMPDVCPLCGSEVKK